MRPSEGSHTKWIHSKFPTIFVNLSGKDGNDAFIVWGTCLPASILTPAFIDKVEYKVND